MKDLYFIDETTKIIFALVELPGKVKMEYKEYIISIVILARIGMKKQKIK